MAGRANARGEFMPRMAAQTGADLAAAIDSGRLPAREAAAARRRCAACLWPEECASWLDAQRGVALPPAFCPNGAVFGALAGVRP